MVSFIASRSGTLGIAVALSLFLATVFSSGPLRAAEAPASLLGDYVGAGCPTRDQRCVPAKPSDRVRISRGADGKLAVSVRIAFDRGQSCAIEGAASWSDAKLTLTADGLDPDKPCQLGIAVDAGTLTLEDAENRCREVYCGSRGTLAGARFKHR